MTDCRRYQDDLKAYADGELPLWRLLAVRGHLSRCAACRKELTAMQQLADDLRTAEGTETLNPALRAKIIAAQSMGQGVSQGAAQEGMASHAPTSPTLPHRFPSGWQLAGAGAIVFVLWALLSPTFNTAREKARNVTATAQMPAPSVAAGNTAPQRKISYPGGGGGGYPGGASLPLHIPSMPMPAGSGGSIAAITSLSRQVHKEAALGVEVADAEAQSDQVAQMVKSAGGFVAANTLSTGDDGRRSADLTVKVPVVQFETVLGQVAKLGKVQAKNITGEDITEKSSDADQAEGVLEDEARRADARLAALGKKAGWRDQQAARDARIQLAQARARLLLLKKMAALSTLTINLTERPKPATPAPVTRGFLSGLGDTLRDATGSLLASAGTLLALVIWILAYAPLWLPLAFLGRYAYRRYRQTAA